MVSYPYYPLPQYQCAPDDKEGEYACFQVNITKCAVTGVNFTFTKVFPFQRNRVVTYTLFYGGRRHRNTYAGTIHYCVIADSTCPDHREFISATKNFCPFVPTNINLFYSKNAEFRRLLNDRRRAQVSTRSTSTTTTTTTTTTTSTEPTTESTTTEPTTTTMEATTTTTTTTTPTTTSTTTTTSRPTTTTTTPTTTRAVIPTSTTTKATTTTSSTTPVTTTITQPTTNVTPPFNTTPEIQITKAEPDEKSTLFLPTTGVNESSVPPSIEKIRKKLREREASLQRWTSWFLLLLGISMTAATVTMFLMLKKLRKLVDESAEKVRGSTPGGSARSVIPRKALDTSAQKKASSAGKKLKLKQPPKKAAQKQTAPKQPLASPLKDIMQLYDTSKDVGAEDEEKNSKKGSDSNSQSPDNQKSAKKVITGPNLLEKQDVMFGGLVHL